ncbi:hypothetical protein BON30_16350 [Cystobacter ferrugineus]|uniref:Uncharacterized protein n=1 Tax=Cystobacter ferrugineus TaxID=83449 RepID=A0A1L9BA24_9BACT|nr:hypothetical protein BON30_16350 [Cystobacter ferrugineus]
MAYVIGYALATVSFFVGLLAGSVPWLALGAWLAVSLTVLVIDHAVSKKTPSTGREYAQGFGAAFRGSSEALIIISVLAVFALLAGIVVRPAG